MKQLLKELVVMLFIIPISVGILFFLMQKAEKSREIETFPAVVEKKELHISSPIFGSIESLPVVEGDIIRKSEPIAELSVIDQKNPLTIDSELFIYDATASAIYVVSPVDAVVVKKELAEKSTIKPTANLVTLHPLSNTQIKIRVDGKTNLRSFQSLYLTNEDESLKYSITLSDRLPVSEKENEVYYYASLGNSDQAKDFYHNQQLKIKAQKKPKVLTGKIEQLVTQFSENLRLRLSL